MRTARVFGVIVAIAIFTTGVVSSGVLNAYYYTAVSEINERIEPEFVASTSSSLTDKLLGVDRTRVYVDALSQRTTELEGQVEVVQQENAGLEVALNQQKKENDQLNESLAQEKEELRQVQNEMQALKTAVSRLENTNRRLQQENHQLPILQAEVQNLGSTVAALQNSNRQLQQSLRRIEDQLRKERNEVRVLPPDDRIELPKVRLDIPDHQRPIKVIFLSGIGSASNCKEHRGVEYRLQQILAALRDNPPPEGIPPLMSLEVIGFSYSGLYTNCVEVIVHGLDNRLSPSQGYTYPIYSVEDTCLGVQRASIHLEDLVEWILDGQPEARIVLVAHSLGGMVAAYYISQQPVSFVQQHIQRVVTIDSPLLGHPLRWSTSACYQGPNLPPLGQSWPDINGDTEVVPAIRDIKALETLSLFMNVNSTNIGDYLPGAELVQLGCGYNLFGIIPQGHDCAFTDPQGKAAISRAVNEIHPPR